MNVLVIGNGAREHTICWKIKQSPKLNNLYQLPFSSLINEIAKSQEIDIYDFQSIINFCKKENINFVIVGPEGPLSKGISDKLEKENIKVFGPKLKGATLESSKQIAKEFMKRNYIPTADFKIIYDSNEAKEYLKNYEKYPLVIKADGLAQGKGVRICQNKEEAFNAVKDFMEDKIFGNSGSKIIVEEFLEGYECSLMAIVDGKNFLTLPLSKDHKRLLDDDKGPNTGGMGAICPFDISEELFEEIKNEVLWRFMTGIYKEKIDYRGLIYAGLMITKNGPKVLEFNTRFGDPETQAILPLIEDDLLEILFQASNSNLEREEIKISKEKSICLVLSSQGYPDNPKKGDLIEGIENIDKDILVFYSGTEKKDNKYYTSGGRVLSLVSKDINFNKAKEKVYLNAEKINFNGKHYRKDIGKNKL